MTKKLVTLCLLAVSFVCSVNAQEGPVPKGIKHLDHVFVIMMENHGYTQILHNPNAPFINQFASSANLAQNYFAIGHPSLTNYLEVVGGSNFGVRSDDYPNWHSISCTPNLSSGLTAFDNPAQSPAVICPIAGSGTDAATPALDCTNEVQIAPLLQPAGCYWNLVSPTSTAISASSTTIGKTIADQLYEHGKSWKTYQEDLPITGPDLVNISDGFFTNNTNFSSYILAGAFTSWTGQGKDAAAVPPVLSATLVPPITTQTEAQGDIPYLYAVKHNPFVYFKNVQDGYDKRNSLRNVAGFDGGNGLYADLASNNVPNFSFIAPNQCNDMHGRGNAGPFCNYDANDDGTQSGLNGTLIQRGDVTVQRIVSAIHDSRTWNEGNNAIVLLWDENDYTATPNQVMLIVDTNDDHDKRHDHDSDDKGVASGNFYNHFSLLRSMEAGFGLPCLNHACDGNVSVMTDLFGK